MAMNFATAIEYADHITIEGDLLEIGSNRGENSTLVLGELAAKKNKTLFSVDVDPEIISINESFNNESPSKLPIEFRNMTGEEFLKSNKHLKFSVVLLDNFDWDWNVVHSTPEWTEFINEHKARYKKIMGVEMTNVRSQMTHLEQAMLLVGLLTEDAIIICDDTYQLTSGTFNGKCGAAVPFLMLHGFEVKAIVDYGMVLTRCKIK